MAKKAVGLLVGGGPAPGINGVISAATIEAVNRGYKVFGISNGFSKLMNGDEQAIQELTIPLVSRIHAEGGSILGTSRANPTQDGEVMANVLRVLRKHSIGYLVTIGGDDTAFSAAMVAESAGGDIAVGHVPKTIDNDLPLPGKASTFGFQTAREVGSRIVETLMEDAKTTGRWYLVIAMGRKAGHLALGIGIAVGATLTIIPEEFPPGRIPLSLMADIIIGSILKRLANGRNHGVCVLAEGLAEKLEPAEIAELKNVEKDPHGNIRYSDLDFGGIIKRAVQSRLKELGVKMTVLDKNVGYELRCHPPITFDREYTRTLGFGVIDFLLSGGSSAMIARQGDMLVPIPFADIRDPETGKTKIRLVETDSLAYRVAQKYMIRLTEEDLKNDVLVSKMASFTKRSPDELRQQLKRATSDVSAYSNEINTH